MARGGPPRKTDEDRSLWAAVTSTVRPLTDRPRAARGLDAETQSPEDARSDAKADRRAAARRRIVAAAAEAAGTPKPAPAAPPPALSHGMTVGVDRRTATRLRRGKLAIDGRIDLHGMSREAAHRALIDYLLDAHAAEKRCIVVVTGKGRGILQEAVPHWLNLPPLRSKILAFDLARPEHGGSGALYVLLKRRRG